MAEDPLSAALEEIRKREQARDIPALLAAVEAVTALHAPVKISGGNGHVCSGCSRADPSGRAGQLGSFKFWPCATVQAITKALLGKAPNG